MRISILFPILILLANCGGDNSNGGTQELSGQDLYELASEEGNSFACASCHALAEPAPDGLRRPGHAIGDATKRPNYKNGQLENLLDAVNSCRDEWMNAPTWQQDDSAWLALFEFLDAQSSTTSAPPLAYEIKSPPTSLDGGDAEAGRALFNTSCTVCHGNDAEGTGRGPALNGATLEPTQIARRIRTSGRSDSSVYNGLTNGIMPFWAADRLSDAELLDLVAFVDSNRPDNTGENSDAGMGANGANGLRQCPKTHSKIGQSATLVEIFHNVSGTATIIDDCTIEITNFTFDGEGVDVRFYSGLGGNFTDGFSMSEDLRLDGGYENRTVYAQLPEANNLDQLDGISVWCVPLGVSFGDGAFQTP